MNYSINNSIPFSAINWNSFENRPQMGKGMPICKENDWYEDKKCCMDGYSIEHVLDVAHEYGHGDTPEVKFLDEYPCLNGLELDRFVDQIETMPSDYKPKDYSWPAIGCVTKSIFSGLSIMLPENLMTSIKPYLCKEE